MEKVKLDLIPGKVLPVCHASQYDVGRIIRFELVENDTPYTLDGTETVTLGERKIDGNVVTAALTVVASKTYVDLITTEQMTACYGQNLCELKIEKGSDIIGTLNFVLDVERDPLEGGVQSESEIYNLQVQINEIIQQELENYDIYGAYVTEQISGAIANFTDGADNVPVKALSVEFEATQASGTPTPSSPIPITPVNSIAVTRTGKNLWSNEKAVTDSNTATVYISDEWLNFKTGGNPLIYKLKSDTQVTFQAIAKASSNDILNLRAYYTDGTYTQLVYVSLTANTETTISGTTASGKTLDFIRSVYTNNTSIQIKNVQLEFGSTATAYEPYQGITALINLGGTYYGGSVDVVTGKITLTRKIVDMGGLSWSYVSANNLFSSNVVADMEVLSWNTELQGKFLCECGKPKATNTAWSNLVDYEYGTLNGAIRFKDSNFTDAALFKANISGNKIMYPLATPIVVYASNTAEITTILGVNNFFSDAGDVDVTIRADTALYIDKRLNA